VDIANAAEIQGELLRLLDTLAYCPEPVTGLVVDLSDTTFLDTTAVTSKNGAAARGTTPADTQIV
jgi:anti-anti-sigma regulatory factor